MIERPQQSCEPSVKSLRGASPDDPRTCGDQIANRPSGISGVLRCSESRNEICQIRHLDRGIRLNLKKLEPGFIKDPDDLAWPQAVALHPAVPLEREREAVVI